MNIDQAEVGLGYYQHEKLERDEVRLLRYDPESDGSMLRFYVDVKQRDEAGAYTALSYTWGDEPESMFLLLNGLRFSIRPNLWWALFYLVKCHGRVKIWADGICINQKDIPEKNHQVAHMDKIYRQAADVVAWLGYEGEQHVVAGNVPQALREPHREPRLLRLNNEAAYWSRVWIIPELFLARRINVMKGSKMLPWDDLPRLADRPEEVMFRLLLDIREEPRPDIFRYARSFLLDKPDLYSLLAIFAISKCSDPRDKVFALLGLLSSKEQDIFRAFMPDYELALEKVQLLVLLYLRKGRGWRGGPPGSIERWARQIPEALGFQSVHAWRAMLLLVRQVQVQQPATEPLKHRLQRHFWPRSVRPKPTSGADRRPDNPESTHRDESVLALMKAVVADPSIDRRLDELKKEALAKERLEPSNDPILPQPVLRSLFSNLYWTGGSSAQLPRPAGGYRTELNGWRIWRISDRDRSKDPVYYDVDQDYSRSTAT